MKASLWAQRNVKCPFFRGDSATTVKCEGPFDGSKVILVLSEGARKHEEIFCAEHYRKCEIYRMVMEAKYEE